MGHFHRPVVIDTGRLLQCNFGRSRNSAAGEMASGDRSLAGGFAQNRWDETERSHSWSIGSGCPAHCEDRAMRQPMEKSRRSVRVSFTLAKSWLSRVSRPDASGVDDAADRLGADLAVGLRTVRYEGVGRI